MKASKLCIALLLVTILLQSGCLLRTDADVEAPDTPLFTPLPPERTNVTFTNLLSQGPGINRNVLMYEYFYNGGGVAVGDVDGDGRDDIYFTGNMSYNKLYLNQGDMVFKDVTDAAGVAGRKNTWKTGVSMADVNADGLLDIYVCYSGQLPLDRKVDQLFINQGLDAAGIPQFEERAEDYGLSNPHSSNSAAFFDYDRDGDLDLLLLNHNVESLPVVSDSETRQLLNADDPINGTRLYRNDDGYFSDATKEAGIRSSPLSYGLGVGVSDLNNDGWLDVYISNDFSPPDYLYVNNGDGTFSGRLSKMLGHTSYASMGIDVADVNNDGWTDIFVLDMLPESSMRQKLLHIPNDREHFDSSVRLGFHHQYMRNMLHLNNGGDTFSEIGQLAGLSNSDWSWAPLVADYDNDGWKDVFITNGMPHDITNRDYMAFEAQYINQNQGQLNPDDILELLRRLPSTIVANYIYRNNGDLTFHDVTEKWGMSPPLTSHGAAYSDLDNDGDLDLITNNLNAPATIFENHAAEQLSHHFLRVQLDGIGNNTAGVGSKITLFAGGQMQYVEQLPARGYLSSVSPVLHFGLGRHETVDSIQVVWADGVKEVVRNIDVDETITLRQRNASATGPRDQSKKPLFEKAESPISFHHRMDPDIDDFDRQPQLVNPKSFSGPALANSDVNGDGLSDVFVGGGVGQAGMLYLQRKDGGFRSSPQRDFETHAGADDVDAVFFDANGDGHPDLYVASGGYGRLDSSDTSLEDRLYLNDGKGNFSSSGERLPSNATSTGAVAVTDINGDGFIDIFVGGSFAADQYPIPPRSYVLINNGQGHFDEQTDSRSNGLAKVGMVTDATWQDLDGDGVPELIVAGEWMPITVFRIENGYLADRTLDYLDRPFYGLWNRLYAKDLNGDGYPDLLAGNFGLNSQLKADRERPATLYYGDFDNNGSVDPLLAFHIENGTYPFATLDELTDQIPSIRTRFPTYESYARATLDDVFSDEEIDNAGKLRADFLETALFLSDGRGRLTLGELPIEAQIAPVFAVSDVDYDGDGDLDLVLAGNMNEARIRFGKYDANYGILLRGDGKGGFEYVPQRESGFRLRGDVRAILTVGETLIFGMNRQRTQAYRPTRLTPR